MASGGLQVLSDVSDDTIDGADEFEVADLEKGMRKGDLPEELEEDANSSFQPSSEGQMVKETSRRLASRTASKDQDKETVEGSTRKAKRKADAGQGKGKEAGERRSKKKKKRARTAKSTDAELEKMTDAGQEEEVGAQKDGVSDKPVDLTTNVDEPPPPPANPFICHPRLQDGITTVKEDDSGLGRPLVASALMDSVLLPSDVNQYLQHSERALMNRLTELTYEANVIRAAAAKKQEYHASRLASREERVKILKEAGETASKAMEKQLKMIDALKLDNTKLKGEIGELHGRLAAEEEAKAALVAEKTALATDKAKAEAALDELKQNFILEKDSMLKEKADLSAELEATRSNLSLAEEASKKNFTKGQDWQDHAHRRGDFIADVLLKLGDTLSPEQRIQMDSFARDHKLNLNSIKEWSARKRKIAVPKTTTTEKPATVSQSSIGQGSGGQGVSEVSAMEKN